MNTRLHVLVIEDSQNDFELIVREFEQAGYDVVSHRARTREAMLTALDHRPWDAVLSDNSTLCFDALQAIQLLRQIGRDVTFIVTSDTADEKQAVEWIRAGADGYVLKSDLRRLPSVVERAQREVGHQAASPSRQSAAFGGAERIVCEHTLEPEGTRSDCSTHLCYR